MTTQNSRRITVAEMAPHVHNYAYNENKSDKILLWLKNWIVKSLELGSIKPFDLLPSKAELSYHMGVSKGTMQNVIRRLENMGYVESKQKIGTFIKPANSTIKMYKLTSKSDVATEQLKKYILENKYKIGDVIPSIRKLSVQLNVSNTTMRLAVIQLIAEDILILKDRKYIIKTINFKNTPLTKENLVAKSAQQIKKYIQTHFKTGEKIPSTDKLAKMYNVSIKTIYDAIKLLSKEGLLYSRRGQYGTVILNMQEKDLIQPQYCYEKIEAKIREYMHTKCKAGNKLPTISELAEKYKTSGKTIKKAIDNLVQEGYLTSTRGRYGGIYIIDIPSKSKDAYKWLAINAEYIPEMDN